MKWKKILSLFLLAILITSVSAEPIINPIVQGKPFWCKFFLTGWICENNAGAQGPQGPTGPAGESGNISIYNVSYFDNSTFYNISGIYSNESYLYNTTIYGNLTLNASTINFYNLTYSEMNQTPNMTAGPEGPQGIRGIQGIPGLDNMTAGPQGLQGDPGTAATVNVNYTFTGATGSDASVVNVGTALDAELDFTIPSGMMNQTPNMTEGEPGATGGTGGQVLYFWNAASDISGYEGLHPVPAGNTEITEGVTVNSGTGQVLVDSYATVDGYPNLTTLPAGLWRFRTYHNVSGASGNTQVVFKIYNRTYTGTETLLFTATSGDINSLTPIEYLTSYVQTSDYTILSTDRIVTKVYGQSDHASNIVVNFVYEGSEHTSHILTPIAIGATDLVNYAYLPGRPGGQTLNGGTTTGELILIGNSGGGNVSIQPNAGSVIAGNQTFKQTILGFEAGLNNTALYQVAIGYLAGYQNTAIRQTAIGYGAGYQNTAIRQTAIGYYAGYQNTGAEQTAMGYAAGYKNTGASQTAMGYYSGQHNAASNTITIGYQSGRTNQSNYFEIKHNNVNTNALISGNLSSGVVSFPNYGAGTLNTDANGVITAVSDEKAKTDIKSSTKGLANIKNIEPITYKYKNGYGLDTENTYLGLSAQNLEKSIPEAVFSKPDYRYETKDVKFINAEGEEETTTETIAIATGTDTKTVSDRAIIAVLINALQEEDAKVETMKLQIDNLTKRIEKLESKIKP